MVGNVCADSFDFWWNTVKAATESKFPKTPEPAVRAAPVHKLSVTKPEKKPKVTLPDPAFVTTSIPGIELSSKPTLPPAKVRPLRFTDFDTCATVHKEFDNAPAPLPSLDPFALLKSCEGARRKMSKSSIDSSFKKLRARFDLCEKHLLVQKMTKDFDKEKFKCALCPVEVDAFSFIPHICGEKHLDEMDGSVCADAFDFWWNVVKAAI